jgi:hypothetical protein
MPAVCGVLLSSSPLRTMRSPGMVVAVLKSDMNRTVKALVKCKRLRERGLEATQPTIS